MILVTAATGNVGSQVVRALADRGAPFRALVRDAERARGVLGGGVDLVQGDFADAGSIRSALEGVERLFLASANHPDQVSHEATVIDAAAAAGVAAVVKLSAVSAHPESSGPFQAGQGRIEEHLRRSGLPAVVLQPNYYMSNLLQSAESVRREGRLFAPLGDARIAMIDPRDVGEAAAAALTEPGHEGQTYLLSGPEAITYGQVAEELSAATGRLVEFVDVPEEGARQGMTAAGLPEWFVEGLLGVYRALREGVGERTSDEVLRLTGHPPRGFDAFARDHSGAFGADDGPAPGGSHRRA